MPPDTFDPRNPVDTALRTAQQLQTNPSPSYIGQEDPLKRRLNDSGLYSHAADVVARMPQAKGTPEQFKAMLLKQGVKPDELKWSSYDNQIGDKPSITKDELVRHFNRSLPKVQEKLLSDDDYDYDTDNGATGGPQYKDYALPGGKNYRELLLHLPSTQRREHAWEFFDPATQRSQIFPNEQAARRAAPQGAIVHQVEVAEHNPDYRSSHWADTPNVLAHIRMSDRALPNHRTVISTPGGTKVRPGKALHVEELQSDWAQDARQKGFHPAEGGVPHAPYIDSTGKWLDLALKRVLHEAAHGGHSRVLITPGEEQTKRYDLSKHIHSLRYNPPDEKYPRGNLQAFDHANMQVHDQGADPHELPGIVGKEAAERLLATSPKKDMSGRATHFLTGENLKLGGEGMRAFYDKIVPAALEKLARKHDPEARVQLHSHQLHKGRSTAEIDRDMDALHGPNAPHIFERRHAEYAALQRERDKAEGQPETALHSLEVTPRMRESIKRGQPAYAAGGAVTPDTQPVPEETDEHPARIPTRLVTSKKLPSLPTDDVDMATFRSTPDLYKRNVDLVRNYPNMRADIARKKHDDVADELIRHSKENLLALHDAVPPDIRNRSKLWYDGARKIADRWSDEYRLPDHSIAGALAALSPQKDWYQNVSLAHRVLHAMRGPDDIYGKHPFTPEMVKTFRSRRSLAKPRYAGLIKAVTGKTMADLDRGEGSPEEKAAAKALWIRMHDETYNSPAHPIVTPEGGFGEPVKTNKGAPAKVAWGSLNEIGKAVRAIEAAHDPAQLSRLMGERHKVRNFYNNILAPNSKRGDVTIDTHAVAAALMRPLSGNSLEVAHNFANHPGVGLPAAGGSAMTGIQGLYPLYAHAYREAAKERGILPREMQSITWEAIRGLFPDTFKTAANNARVNHIWSQYRSGKIDQGDARRQINELAGGVRPPTWWNGGAGARQGGPGADEAPRGAPDAGELPRPGIRRPAAGAPVGGGRGRPAGAVSPTLSGQGKAAKVTRTAPTVEHALKIAAEATR